LGGFAAWQEAGYPVEEGDTGYENGDKEAAYKDISVEELQDMLEKKDFWLVNVHIPFGGNIPQTDAVIPFDEIPANLGELPADKGAKLVVYCKGDSMSKSAANELTTLGYTNVIRLDGGYTAWEEAGLTLVEE
jgi:rhodanese-related sulfurtransferase